jgi:Family of unknown function (DUF5677)
MDVLDIFIKNLSRTKKDFLTLTSEYFFDKFSDEFDKLDIEFCRTDDYINLLKNRDYRTGFISRILHDYSDSFYLLEIFFEKCLGILVNFREKNIKKMSKNPSFLALLRLLGRSILISGEIIILLKNGFPSGALARWRSLFETSIFSMLISSKGNSLAKRYLDYIDIETYNEAKTYKENSAYLEIEDHEIDLLKLEKRKNELEKIYGIEFSKQNGWAVNFLNIKKGKLPSIKEILIELKQTHMYPYYKFSNIPLHAGPKNLFFDLAKINGNIDDKIVAGPSNIGFTEPAQLTALSLYNSVGALLSVHPKEEHILELIILRTQIKEIGTRFLEVQANIEKKENNKTKKRRNA